MSEWDDYVDAVKQRMQILDVVQPDVPDLKKTGSCWKGTSPWRPGEKDPSLVVWEHSNTFRDFGQDIGGDPITWLMERHQMRFHEAIGTLADKYGIPKPAMSPEYAAKFESRMRVNKVLNALAAYYHAILPDKIRREVLRGKYTFTDETIDRYQLGWAPTELDVKGYDGKAYRYLRGQNFERDELLGSGAFITFKNRKTGEYDGQVKDFFHDRLIFPYPKGGSIGSLIGRRVEPYSSDEAWEQPKYKKLMTRTDKHPYISESLDNDIFYNEDCIIRPVEDLMIAEGVTDCLSAMQAGIPCISPVTVRFRNKDLNKIRTCSKKAKRVIVCNDSEVSGAGQRGALDTMGKLFAAGVDVRYMDLPRPEGTDKIDLNEFCSQHGDEAGDKIRELMVAAKRLPEFFLEQIPKDTPDAEVGKAIEPVVDLIVNLSAIEQSAYVKAIARRFSIGKNDIKKLMRDRRIVLSAQKKQEEKEIRERLKGEIHIGATGYFCRNIEGDIVNISSFLVTPTQRIVIDGIEHLKCDLTTDKKKTIKGVLFQPTAWASRRSLVAALARVSPDLQWTGSDDQVQGLLRICADVEVPKHTGTTVIGWMDTDRGPRWVGPDLVLSKDGVVTDEDLSYVPTGNPLATRLKYRIEPEEKVRAVVGEALDLMLRVNKAEVTLPLIGWYFTAPLRKKIIEVLGHSPIGWTWGTQGSGKSSVNQQFWRMHGIADIEPFSSTETEFSSLRLYSGTNGVPIEQDEFKPGDMQKRQVSRVYRNARRLYSGETESRGRPDLTLSTFALMAPVMTIGECRPDDPAVCERIICISPDKNTIELDAAANRAFAELRRCDLGAMTVAYLQFCLGRDVKADLDQARTITDYFITKVKGGEDLPTRVVDNLVVMNYGLMLYQEFGKRYGVEIADPDVEAAIRSQTQEFTEGDGGAKDLFDQFLEAMSIYAQEGTLKEGTHYVMCEGHLLLHLPSAYVVYQREVKRQGLDDMTNGLRALRRIVREKSDRAGYIVENNSRAKLENGFLRCVRIDVTKMPETLDVEAFPVTAQRSWGGDRFAQDED